jgi:Fic family protein
MAIAHDEITLRWEPDPATLGGRRSRTPVRYRAYVPGPIAELDPLVSSSALNAITEAEAACDRLETSAEETGVNLETVARQLLRAESVASSRIEGLMVSHRRLAKAAFTNGQGDFAAQSVLRNISGLEHALRLATDAERITRDTIVSIHAAMFEGTVDARHAGAVRDRQNWIGREGSTPATAEFVPPPADAVEPLLDDLAVFASRGDLSAVLQAAIVHADFETIHPFWDGNGRVGRALIHVVLRRRGVATRFLPPVSLVLANNAEAYVRGLTSYRFADENDWYAIFADALRISASGSADFAERVRKLQQQWRERAGDPRRDSAAAKLIELLPSHPVVNLRTAMELTGASDQAVLRAFQRLQEAEVIRQTTIGRRNRAFESVGLFALMDEFERELGPADRTPVASRPRASQ